MAVPIYAMEPDDHAVEDLFNARRLSCNELVRKRSAHAEPRAAGLQSGTRACADGTLHSARRASNNGRADQTADQTIVSWNPEISAD